MPEYPQDDLRDERSFLHSKREMYTTDRTRFIALQTQVMEPIHPDDKDILLQPIKGFREEVELKYLTLRAFEEQMREKDSPVSDQATALASTYYVMIMILDAMINYILLKDNRVLTDVLTAENIY